MSRMTTEQRTAFNEANGSGGMEAAELNAVVITLLYVVMLVWFAWVCISAYRSLKQPGTQVLDVALPVLRGLALMLAILAVTLMD